MKCFPKENATSLLPSFLRRSIISERRFAHLLIMQFQKEVTMSVFEEIDSKILEEIVLHFKSSTSYLDTLPISFFKSVLYCLEGDLLEVVNASLISGTFPNSLTNAVVKSLLKKRNPANTMLSNYRPISNLPFIGKTIEKGADQILKFKWIPGDSFHITAQKRRLLR